MSTQELFSESWKRRVFCDLIGRGDPDRETRIQRAVLQCAVEDYVRWRDEDWGPPDKLTRTKKEALKRFRSARSWVFHPTPPKTLLDVAMTFERICLLLDLDPPSVRKLCETMSSDELRAWMRARSEAFGGQ